MSLTKQTSDVLTYWLDQREQTVMDSETYNQMIECLVGHAQMIRDGNQKEVAKTSIFENKLRKVRRGKWDIIYINPGVCELI